MELPAEVRGYNVRALDGTLVKEPGRSGSLWRIHYSLRIPSLVCDHLELTSVKGAGTGESLGRFPASPGDLVLADRGFCKPGGVEALHRQGAAVMVRLNSSSLPLWDRQGSRFGLSEQIRQIKETGAERNGRFGYRGTKSVFRVGCALFARARRRRRGPAAALPEKRSREDRNRSQKHCNTPAT